MLDGVYLSLQTGPLTTSPAPRSVIDALTEVQATQTSGQQGGFQLRFTYGRESDLARRYLPSGMFAPAARVVLVLTLGGSSTVLADGVVVQHDIAQSSQAGQSTLSITGTDVSRMLDLVDLSGVPLPPAPSSALAMLLLAPAALYGVTPMVVPSVLDFVTNPLDTVETIKGTPLAHLRMLAGQAGYIFEIRPGPAPGANIGYWGPEVTLSVPQPALSVNMDAETNVESLSFGYDGFGKSLNVLFVHSQLTKVPIPVPVPDVTLLSPPLGRSLIMPRKVSFLNRAEPPDEDDSTAKYPIAKTALLGVARASKEAQVISGSGSIDVLRYGRLLEARRLVSVRGTGELYDGEYFVSSVTTTLKRGELKQSFRLSRNAFKSLTGKATV